MSARTVEHYVWGLIGVVITLIMARTFLEATARWAPGPFSGLASRGEALAGIVK